MYIIKIISIFVLILLNGSCKSSSYLSSEQENKKYDYYLYPLEDKSSNSRNDIICQYKCIYNHKSTEDSCDMYYVEFDSSQLDETTLELIQNPKLFESKPSEPSSKTFKLKNLKALSNLQTKKDTKDFCHISRSTRVLFIPNSNFYSTNYTLLISITEEDKNDTWSKCSVSYHPTVGRYTFPVEIDMFCRKNKEGGYLILHTNIVHDSSDVKFKDPESFVFKLVKQDTIRDGFLKENDIINNIEYLGLTRNDIIITDTEISNGFEEYFSLTYGDFIPLKSPFSPPNVPKRLYYLNTYGENEDLYFPPDFHSYKWKNFKVIPVWNRN